MVLLCHTVYGCKLMQTLRFLTTSTLDMDVLFVIFEISHLDFFK